MKASGGGQTHTVLEDGFLPYAASLCWRPYLVHDLLVQGILGGGVCSSLTIQTRDWTDLVTCLLVASHHKH